MEQMSIPLAVTLISISWSVGLFVGLFTARFVSKKECEENQCKIWERIDAIQNVLVGGRMTFELRPMAQGSCEQK